MRPWLGLAAAVAAACGGSPEVVDIHLGDIVDASGEGRADRSVGDGAEVTIHLDGEARVVEVAVAGGTAELDGEAADADGWFRPRPVTADQMVLTVAGGPTEVTVWARGAPVPAARIGLSLVWNDPPVVDDRAVTGLGRVLGTISEDGHGGAMLDAWFRRFATTSHSERAAPAQLMDEIAATLGADPTTWDLDALPFDAAAVHNRIDLAPRTGDCGELRVLTASMHPIYAPLYLIFMFRQAPEADDVAPDGTVHCLGTARRWARLSALEGEALVAAQTAWLDAVLVRDRFLMAETVELTVSPWEWRQWVPIGDDQLDNPLLFQTVDTPALNQPGPLRDDFLTWVDANRAALTARTAEIPERFRARSARVTQGVPRELLDVGDADLAAVIESVGCPACHTTNAEFIHSKVSGEFSPFYDAELEARAARLDLMNAGSAVPVPPFGPLQD